MPWMPGTTIVGLPASPAKSVTAKARNRMRAGVHRIVSTGRTPDGLGGDLYAHAAVGRPHRGQKFPRNRVPQRGQGQTAGAAAGAAGGGGLVAGAPQRGQKRPSKGAPHRTHCIQGHTRERRYLMLRSFGVSCASSCLYRSVSRRLISGTSVARLPPSSAGGGSHEIGGLTKWKTRIEAGGTGEAGWR